MLQQVDGDRTVTSSLIFNETSVAAAGDYLCFVCPASKPQKPAPAGYKNTSGSVSFLGQVTKLFSQFK